MKYRISPYLYLIILTQLLSCIPTQKSKEAESEVVNGNNNKSPLIIGNSASPVNGNCDAPGVGNQVSNYFNFDEIIQKGKNAGVVAWSSANDSRLTNQQNLFITDSRFNVRVLAKPSPGKGNFPNGVICNNLALPYTKLQVKVSLRYPQSLTPFKSYIFNNIQVGSCSNVYEFNPPPNNQAWSVEISDVKWDYSCISDSLGQNHNPSLCPWDYVWANDCYELSLQWATDHSKDIPH